MAYAGQFLENQIGEERVFFRESYSRGGSVLMYRMLPARPAYSSPATESEIA
jgi:hypothetical protein